MFSMSKKNIVILLVLIIGLPNAAMSQPANRKVDSTIVAVNELSDLTGNEWAYSAIKELVEKYDVLEGYPNGTFQGERKPTRFELAQALYDLATYFADEIALDREDLAKLAKLLDEFSGELKALQARVDKLEGTVNNHETRIVALEAKDKEHDAKLAAHDKELAAHKAQLTEHEKRLAYLERRKGFILERLIKGLVVDARDISRGLGATFVAPFNKDVREAIRK